MAFSWAVYFREVNRFLKKLISCILALLLLTTAAFAVPGDSCVVLGEELTLGETDGIFTALGVERGTAMELALSRPDAETYFSDVAERGFRSRFPTSPARRPPLRRHSPPPE